MSPSHPGTREYAAAPVSDWTTQATDAIEKAVVAVRERTVEPAQAAAKAVVYGLLAAVFVAGALVLASLGIFRLVASYMPGGIWATHTLFGGIFTVAGAFCWAQRNRVPAPEE